MSTFGIVGRYMASFTVNGVDLTDLNGFESCKFAEESGNQLPTFELIFRTSNTGLLTLLNTGNSISAGIGVTGTDLTTSVRPTSVNISRSDGSTLRIKITGTYDAISYLNNTNTKIFANMNATDAISSIVGKYFNTDIGNSSNDSMNWCQPGHSDQGMIDHLWQHSNFGNSSDFPIIGITTDGTFRLRTASQLSDGNFEWNFTNASNPGGNTVPFHYDYDIQSDAGFVNATAAYPKTSDIVDVDNGPGATFTSAVSSFLGQSGSLDQSSSIVASAAGALLSNINHHDMFHQSRENNVSNIANASSVKINLSNSDIYFPIRLIDRFMFSDYLEDASSIQSFSGIWLCSEVCRTIENQQFVTHVTGVRESMNFIITSS